MKIKHLHLTMVVDRTTATSADAITGMVTLLLNSCERLTSLTIHACQRYRRLRFSLKSLPSTSWFSSTLPYLDIAVSTFDDCLLLLDGRVGRLKTLIISIDRISTIIEPRENTVCVICGLLKEPFVCFDSSSAHWEIHVCFTMNSVR